MPSRERVRELIALVEGGKYVEALVKHEQAMLAAFNEVRTLPVESFLVDGDRVVINWVFELVARDGRKFRMDELAHQVWRGNRIVRERFYYDPARQEI